MLASLMCMPFVGSLHLSPVNVASLATIVRTSRCVASPPPSLVANSLIAADNAHEIITVEARAKSATTASLELWTRAGVCYSLVGGPWSAELGRKGLSAHKSEGDGTTPSGTFGIGAVMYGILANPGVAYPYHDIVCGDWWDEASSSPMYNRFVHVGCGAPPPFGGDSEALWRVVPQYDYFAVIDYNTTPVIAGRGSAIFLHLSIGEPTAGCIALPRSALLTTLRWLRPNAHPVIVIGTAL
jgi:L,D-peptidoglycan transpeptidase YkuD (ErfK/YbiS/YcfS/YnhG family)